MKANASPLLLAGAVALVLGYSERASSQTAQTHDHASVIFVNNMCCPAESMPAVNELSKIPGVKKVTVDYKTKSLTVTPKGSAFPEPLALWEAAEKARVQPVRLITAHGTFNEKPRRQ